MRTRIKFCGFTNAEDVNAATRLGVDALGFVFYPPSPRAISAVQATLLGRLVPAFVSKVALFVNPSRDDVEEVVRALKPDLLQFHGDESVEFCEHFDRPYIKAFRVGAENLSTVEQLHSACGGYDSARSWLFDSYSDSYGGSGRTFNWDLLKSIDPHRLVLSGGLSVENVQEAMTQIKPYALDISSGIEQAKGIKCRQKMQTFVSEVFDADRRLYDSRNF